MYQRVYYGVTMICLALTAVLFFTLTDNSNFFRHFLVEDRIWPPHLDVIEVFPGSIQNRTLIVTTNSTLVAVNTTVTTPSGNETDNLGECNCPFDYTFKDQCNVEVTSKEQAAKNKAQREKEAKERPHCAKQCAHISGSFSLVLNNTSRAMYLDLMNIFDKTLDDIGVPYFLSGGSLLGAYRHHGFIPWDDDIDLFAPLSAKSKIVNALKNLKPTYSVYTTSRKRNIKFSKPTFKKIKKYPYPWPYIDVFFYEENSKDIIGFEPDKKYYYEKSKVFPLKKRPFCDLQLNTGNDITYMAKKRYGTKSLNECVARFWNHELEKRQKNSGATKVPCSTFDHVYPHVVYSDKDKTEWIKIGETVLRTYQKVAS